MNLIRARLMAWVAVAGALIGVVGNLAAGDTNAAIWAGLAGLLAGVLALTFRGWQVDRGLLARRLQDDTRGTNGEAS